MGITAYFERAGELFVESPAFALLGILLCVAIAAGYALSDKVRWFALALLLVVASLDRGERTAYFDISLVPQMQFLVNNSRVFTVALLASITIGALGVPRGQRTKVLASPVLALLALELVFCGKYFASGEINRGIVTPLAYLMMFVAITHGIGNSLQVPADVKKLAWAVVLCVAVLQLMTLFHLAVRPNGVIANGRLYSVVRTPQAAGTTYVFGLLASVYLIVGTRGVKNLFAKPLLFFVAGLSVIFIVWTGSRTAALSTVVALLLLFRQRVTLLAIIGSVVGVVVVWLASIYQESVAASGRLLSTQDTRSEAWGNLIKSFMENPIYGIPIQQSSAGESSYLGIAATTGLIGLLFLVPFMLWVLRDLASLQFHRKAFGNEAMAADYITASIGALLVASVFDAYLQGATTFHVFYLYAMLAGLACLVEHSRKVAELERHALAAGLMPLPQRYA